MGTVAIQTQCCIQERDDWDDDDRSMWSALTAALLARLLAHRPRCPGASQTQAPSSPRAEGRPVQMHVNVTLRM